MTETRRAAPERAALARMTSGADADPRPAAANQRAPPRPGRPTDVTALFSACVVAGARARQVWPEALQRVGSMRSGNGKLSFAAERRKLSAPEMSIRYSEALCSSGTQLRRRARDEVCAVMACSQGLGRRRYAAASHSGPRVTIAHRCASAQGRDRACQARPSNGATDSSHGLCSRLQRSVAAMMQNEV